MKLYEFLTQFYAKHGPTFKGAGIGGISSGLLLFSDPTFGEHYIVAFIIRMAGVFFGTFFGGLAGLIIEKLRAKFLKQKKDDNRTKKGDSESEKVA